MGWQPASEEEIWTYTSAVSTAIECSTSFPQKLARCCATPFPKHFRADRKSLSLRPRHRLTIGCIAASVCRADCLRCNVRAALRSNTAPHRPIRLAPTGQKSHKMCLMHGRPHGQVNESSRCRRSRKTKKENRYGCRTEVSNRKSNTARGAQSAGAWLPKGNCSACVGSPSSKADGGGFSAGSCAAEKQRGDR